MAHSDDDPLGLKAQLRELGGSQKELAAFMGVEFDVVHRIANGKRKRVSVEERQRIDEYLDKLRGRESGAKVLGMERIASARSDTVPLFGFAAAGPGGPVHLDHEHMLDRVPRHPAQLNRPDAFAFEVWGESMSPRWEPREIGYAVMGLWPARNTDAIIEFKDGDAYLKRYIETRGEKVLCRQFNPEQDVTYDLKDIKAIHAVVG